MFFLWEFIKFLGFFLFCIGLMGMSWLFLQSSGKGMHASPPEALTGWPRSRLLNLAIFHLFYFSLLILVNNYLLGGFQIKTQFQHVEGFEGVGIGIMIIIVGLTDSLGAKYLWGDVRKGNLETFDKAAPVIIRCIGVIMVLLGILAIIF